MEEIVLLANHRKVIGKQVKALRRENKLPAIVYGRNIEPLPIEMDLKETSRTLLKLSPSALVVIDVDGERHYALVREKQRNPITGIIRHVDFQAVLLTDRVRADVNLVFVGTSPAVQNDYGILVTELEQLHIECLPTDLPDRIEVDISVLDEIGSSIIVKDLVLPQGVDVVNDLNDLVVVVTTPAAEEVLVTEEEAIEAEEPEVIERGKQEVEGE
jgi:large subunit ribosomal protein L25